MRSSPRRPSTASEVGYSSIPNDYTMMSVKRRIRMAKRLTSDRSRTIKSWILKCKEKDGLLYYQDPNEDRIVKIKDYY